MDRRKLVENCDIIKTAWGCMQAQSKEGYKILNPNSVTVMSTSQSIHTPRFVVDQHRTEFNDIYLK